MVSEQCPACRRCSLNSEVNFIIEEMLRCKWQKLTLAKVKKGNISFYVTWSVFNE